MKSRSYIVDMIVLKVRSGADDETIQISYLDVSRAPP